MNTKRRAAAVLRFSENDNLSFSLLFTKSFPMALEDIEEDNIVYESNHFFGTFMVLNYHLLWAFGRKKVYNGVQQNEGE